MVRNYDAALQFVQDYFQMDFKNLFLSILKTKEQGISTTISPSKI